MPKSQHVSVAMLDAGLASAVMIRRKPIEDYIHRVLTGQTVTPNEQADRRSHRPHLVPHGCYRVV